MQRSTSPLRSSNQTTSHMAQMGVMSGLGGDPTRYHQEPTLGEEQHSNQAATIMTSSMIKHSLAQLRDKLSNMKRDKEAVEIGI